MTSVFFFFELKHILHKLVSCYCKPSVWFIMECFSVTMECEEPWASTLNYFSNFMNILWNFENFIWICSMHCAICTYVALCTMHCATLHLYNSLFEVGIFAWCVWGFWNLNIEVGYGCKHIVVLHGQSFFFRLEFKSPSKAWAFQCACCICLWTNYWAICSMLSLKTFFNEIVEFECFNFFRNFVLGV